MKKIAVLFYCLWISATVFGQSKVFFSLEEAKLAHPDSVINLDLSKQKLASFPVEILKFSNLKSLDLSKNQLIQTSRKK